MSITNYERQMTGNKALYHVCYKLSKWGWNASLAKRDDKGIDIRCINEDGSQQISIRKKGRSGKDRAVDVPSPSDRIMADFWVIVTELDSGAPTCYILLPDEIREGTVEHEKDGKRSYWLDRKYDIEPFKEKWERIGSGFIGSHTGG